MKRSLTIVAVCATVGIGVFTATPASASPAEAAESVGVAGAAQCKNYLKSKGYKVGDKVSDACNWGAAGAGKKCAKKLRDIEVEKVHAVDACHIADVPKSLQQSLKV